MAPEWQYRENEKDRMWRENYLEWKKWVYFITLPHPPAGRWHATRLLIFLSLSPSPSTHRERDSQCGCHGLWPGVLQVYAGGESLLSCLPCPSVHVLYKPYSDWWQCSQPQEVRLTHNQRRETEAACVNRIISGPRLKITRSRPADTALTSVCVCVSLTFSWSGQTSWHYQLWHIVTYQHQIK